MKVNWIKNFGAFLKSPGICQSCQQKCKEADHRVILCSEWNLIFIAFILLFLLGACGCGLKNIKTILPVETKTESGQTIERIEPPRTDSRDNVPVGVEPSHVITHVKTKTGGEVWVVKKGSKVEVYQNPQAKAEGITVDRPKKSWKWLYITIGIIALLLAADFAMRRFLGFNPIATFFKFIGAILGKIFRRKE